MEKISYKKGGLITIKIYLLPASAAAISKKPVVTSETYTCLYSWPGKFLLHHFAWQ